MYGRQTYFFFQLHIFLSYSNTEFSFLCYSLKVFKVDKFNEKFYSFKIASDTENKNLSLKENLSKF